MPCCGRGSKVIPPKPIIEPIVDTNVKYSIAVKTGNQPNAGTNGPVFISIFGDQNKSIEKILLQKSENEKSFETDSLKTIEIKQINIGKPNRIRIEHQDNTNGWFLEYIEITVHNRTTRFVANRWLSLKEHDKKVFGEFYGSEKPDRKYDIEVKTGDDQVEPLTSAAYVQIIGTEGKTPKLYLVPKNGSFPRDSTEFFQISAVDVGQIEKIIIGHEGNGETNDWNVGNIKISSNDEDYDIPINKWLSPTKDEQILSVELDCIQRAPSPELEMYSIKINTIDFQGSNGLTNVRLDIYGTNDEIEKNLIDDFTQTTNEEIFQRENSKDFQFEDEDIGDIESIKIGFESDNLNTAWLLDSIDISYQGKTYHFQAQCCLSNRLGPEFSSITLTPNVDNDDFVDYNIEIETGESGVDSNVLLCIYGDKKITKILPLRTTKDGANAKFDKESQIEFNIKTSDVGKIEKINIGHDGTTDQQKWFLKTVFIEKNDEKETFKAHQWLSKNDKNFIDLFPEEPTVTPVPSTAVYLITIVTSSDENSGTDSNVFMTIFGENDQTKEFQLEKANEDSNLLFKKGQTDLFNFELIDVGTIKKIKIRQDGNGLHPTWRLKEVIIQKDPEIYIFKAEKFLEDPHLSIDLEPTADSTDITSTDTISVNIETTDVKYQIMLQRPIRRQIGNGDENMVYKMVIIGTDGETKTMEIPIDSDVFELSGKDVGKITKAYIVMGNEEMDVTFYVDNIIIKKGEDISRLIIEPTSEKSNKIVFKTQECEYVVRITTNDRNFDVPVTMKIRGHEDEITFPLAKTRNGAKPFQSKATDEFIRNDTDVGKIKLITLLHESKEKDDIWRIRKIQIIKGDEIYNFSLNQLLDSKKQKLVLRPLVEHKGDYVESELNRLKTKLRCESSKMRRTKQKPFTPYVYNNLRPYFDTSSVDKAIAEPLDSPTGYYTRLTALRIVEPWESYGMDYGVNYELYNPRTSRTRSAKSSIVTREDSIDRTQGSTHLPEYPCVNIQKPVEYQRSLTVSDIPRIRSFVQNRYKTKDQDQTEKDYQRTCDDFYRMQLDNAISSRPTNRDNTIRVYRSYLENTPGSRKALRDLCDQIPLNATQTT